MGFGLLLIGYFLTNIVAVISIFSAAMLLGYPLISVALYRLAPYHKRFYFSMWVSLPAPLFALYITLCGLVSTGILPEIAFLGGTVFTVVKWVYFAYTLILNLLILWSLASLATEMKLYSVQSAAWRNMTFLAIYHFIYLVANLPIPFFVAHETAFALPITLLRYLCVFLNLWLFFRCYRYILPEGSDAIEITEDMKDKRKGKKT